MGKRKTPETFDLYQAWAYFCKGKKGVDEVDKLREEDPEKAQGKIIALLEGWDPERDKLKELRGRLAAGKIHCRAHNVNQTVTGEPAPKLAVPCEAWGELDFTYPPPEISDGSPLAAGKWLSPEFPSDEVREHAPVEVRPVAEKGGRPPGVGVIDDTAALNEMDRLIEAGEAKSSNDAAIKVAADAKGTSAFQSKVDRLRKKHRERTRAG